MLPIKLDTMILCLHDTTPGAATGVPEEREYWFDFNAFSELYDTLKQSAGGFGVAVQATSDDGFLSDYTHLYPWAVEQKTTLQCFIPTDFVDAPGRVKKVHLREMHANGVVIGSHGAGHLNWQQVSDQDRWQDIERGKKQLEDILGAEVRVVAPPFGAMNKATHADLRANGFNKVYLTGGGFAAGQHWLQARTSLQNKKDVLEQIEALAHRQPELKDTMRHWYRELKVRWMR